MPVGNQKPGPAAGDSETRHNAIIESLFVSRESDLRTLSEPRQTSLHTATLVPPPVQHRQSFPAELTQGRTAEFAYIPVSRTLSDAHMNTLRAQGQTMNNSSQPAQVTPMNSQSNNNMPIDESSRHVRFADETRQSKRSHSRTGSRLSRRFSFGGKDDFGSLQPDFLNAGIKLKTAAPKSMAYRRAKIMCLLSAVSLFAFILFEVVFMFTCIYLKKSCPSIAAFICRVAMISVIISVLEWTRSYLWRENTPRSEQDLQPHSANEDAMHLSMMASNLNTTGDNQTPANGDFGISSPPADDFTTTGLSMGPPLSGRGQGDQRRRCLDGRQVALAVIIGVFYFTVVVLLLDAAVWIPWQYRLSLEDVVLPANASMNVSNLKNETNVGEKCPTPSIYVSLVYLAMHAIMILLRVVLVCVTSCGNGMRFLASRYRSPARPAEIVMGVPFSTELTTTYESPTVGKERKPRRSHRSKRSGDSGGTHV